MDLPLTCFHCGKPISAADYFCPNCGKKLKEKPSSTSFVGQLGVYLLSFFLPPLGLWPAIKYLKQGDETSKKIGIVAILLTIISIGITLLLVMNIMNSFNSALTNQLDLNGGLGY